MISAQQEVSCNHSQNPNSKNRRYQMDFSKYLFVSPQQYVSAFDEYRYEYIDNGKRFNSVLFKYKQGKDIFKKIELNAWRDNKNVRKLNQFEWRNRYMKLYS
jgi:hypothetical protein